VIEDKNKTKGQLITELGKTRQRIAALEALQAKCKKVEETLRESEERFRLIVDKSHDLILRIQLLPKFKFDYVSPSSLNILGYTPEEFYNSSDDIGLKTVHPEDKKLFEDIQRLEQADPGKPAIVRRIHKDGRLIWTEESFSVIYNNEGKPAAVHVIARDVTKRKQAEKHLLEERVKLEAVIESMGGGLFIVDRDYNITYLNSYFKDLYGDKVGSKCYNIFSFEGENHNGCPVQEAFSSGEIASIERRAVLPDGNTVFLELIASPIRDASGEIYSCLEIVNDITQRKKAEESLRESEEKFRTVFKAVSEGITINDMEWNIIDVNNGILKMFGFDSKEEIIGKTGAFLVDPSDLERVTGLISTNMKKTGSPGIIETTMVRKDNSKFAGENVGCLIYDEENKPNYIVFIMRDITQRKALELERRKLDKMESIGTLAGGIAHDFNNILTGILGNISLAHRYIEADSKAADILNEAEKASMKARDLTSRLLTFARGGEPVKKIFSIADLLKESTAFALRGSNVNCSYSLPDDLRPVEADEGQINQAITNIVINADHAMPEGGILNIAASNKTIKKNGVIPLPKGKYVLISIEDHGCGIPESQLDKIFEPYFSTKQKGSGLGLATTYAIIKNHNGYITVDSQLGIGTTFYIYLPASEDTVIQREEVLEEVPVIGKGRVLIMDDEESINLLLDKLLSEAGYDITTTEDGTEAIKAYKEAIKSGHPFDAVIMDLTIPGGIGGKEAIKELLKINPEAKVIVSSGYSTDPIMANFREDGFSGVVAKPYKTREIEKTLRSVLAG